MNLMFRVSELCWELQAMVKHFAGEFDQSLRVYGAVPS